MITYLNQKLRFLLIFLLAIIAISFIFFGSWTPNRHASSGVMGTIEGHNISQEEFVAAVQEARMMQAFRTGRFLDQTNIEDAHLLNQAWSRLVALYVAKKGGIQTLDEEIIEEIKNNPLFRDEKGYQPERYQRFTIYYLNPQGINLDRFHEMVRNDITINKMLTSVASTAIVQPEEVEKAMNDLFSEAHVWIVPFPIEELKASIHPTPAELKDFFEKNSENYKSPEERSVEFVIFKLSEQDQKLPEAEYKRAFKRLTEEAFYFTGLFLGGTETQLSADSFKQSANEKHLTVYTGSVQNNKKNDDSENVSASSVETKWLKEKAVKQAIFKLTAENPVSDYIPIEHGFVVCHLLQIKAPQPLSLETAQTQVRKDFINRRSRELVTERANMFGAAMRGKIAEGLSWEKAAAELKQKPIKLTPFTAVKGPEGDADYIDIVNSLTSKLKPAEISAFAPTPKGGVVVYLEKRTLPSEQSKASFSKRIQEQILMQRQMQLVDEWLIYLMTQPKTKLPPEILKNLKQEV